MNLITERILTPEQKIDHMRDELSDPDCTSWTCPDCGRSEFRGAVNAVTGERIPFRLECDECGFDAAPFAEKLT